MRPTAWYGTTPLPPDWPNDLGPSECLACYLDPKTGGISKPIEQCRIHVATRIDATKQRTLA